MSNKILLFVFILLIALPAVFAESLVYDNSLFSWETFTVDGRSFTVIVNEMENVVIKYNATQYTSLEIGKNETLQNLRIWLYNITYDLTRRDYKAQLKIYSKAPSLQIARAINDSEFYINEEAEISVNLTNTGTEIIENLTYTEDLTGFNITDVDGDCKQNGNYITFNGNIKIGDDKSCNYIIQGLDELEKSFRAKVTYYDGFEMKDVYSNDLNVKVLPFFKIESKYELINFTTANLVFTDGESETRVGEEFLLIIKLSNLKNDTMDVDYFDIYLPKGFEFVESSSIDIYNGTTYRGTGTKSLSKTGNGTYQWEGDFGNYTILTLKLKSVLIGGSKPRFKAKYQLEDDIERYTEKYGALIESEFYDMAITSNIEENGYYDAGQTYKLRIYAANPSMLVDLKNVNIVFYTNLTNMPGKYYATMDNATQKIIFLEDVKMPFVDSSTNFPLIARADYETEYGDRFSVEYERTMHVEPFKDLIITHTMSDTDFEENEEVEITTKIENKRHVDIYSVNVTDIIPYGFVIQGVSSTSIPVIPKETSVSAYTYKIKMPVIQKETKYNLTTIADYYGNGTDYSVEKRTLFKVNPKQLDLTVSRAFPSNVYKGDMTEIDYTISNPETEEIKNILLLFSLGNEFDTVNRINYTIPRLAPGERIVLNDLEKLRMKFNTSTSIKNAKAVYEDSDGNPFEKNISDVSLTTKTSYIEGPVIIINKTATNGTQGEQSNITIIITNIGTAETDVELRDITTNKFSLGPNNYKTITYKKEFSNGTFVIDASLAVYSYDNNIFYTASNKPTVKFAKKETIIIEQKNEEIKEEVSQGNETEEKDAGIQVVVSPDVKRFVSLMTISTAILVIVLVIFVTRKKQPKQASFLKD